MVGSEEAHRLVFMSSFSIDVTQCLRNVVVEDVGIVLLDYSLQGGNRSIGDSIYGVVTLDMAVGDAKG